MNDRDLLQINRDNIKSLQEFKEEAIKEHAELKGGITANAKEINRVEAESKESHINLKSEIQKVGQISKKTFYWSVGAAVLLGGEALDSNKEIILGIIKQIADNVVEPVLANF